MMTPEQFTEALTTFIRRQPFQPFVVVKTTGERVVIDNPKAVGHSGTGSGGFLGFQDEIHFFDFTNVREFLPVAPETRG
jgi:hypothetical protein